MAANEARRVLRGIGRHIAAARKRQGMTQSAFAEEVLGVSLKYLQRLEAGSENLTIESLVNLAAKLGVPVADFFGKVEGPPARRGRPAKAER